MVLVRKSVQLRFHLLSLVMGSLLPLRARYEVVTQLLEARVQAQRRMTQDRPTNPVNHARADAARARGRARTAYGNHYGTLNPRDEAQAAYAARRRRSSRMKAGPCGAGGIACSNHLVGSVYAGKFM